MDADGTFVEWDPDNGTRVFFVLASSEGQAKAMLTKKKKKKSAPGEFTWTLVDEDGSQRSPVPSPSSPLAPSSPLGPSSPSSPLGPLGPSGPLGPVVTLKDFGVLGLRPDQNDENHSVTIPLNHIVVDPAGLPYITGKREISGAGYLSGEIYARYHLKRQFNRPGQLLKEFGGFPDAVRKNVTAEGSAFAYEYHEGTVIHVVGPNFDESPASTMPEAVGRLKAAYASVIRVAEAHVRGVIKYNESRAYNAYKKGVIVRLPLISMGKFAGKYTNEEKYELTERAVTEAFSEAQPKGTKSTKTWSKSTKSKNGPYIQYWLCLYHNKDTTEYKGYEGAFKQESL
jgi:hypothetical protein